MTMQYNTQPKVMTTGSTLVGWTAPGLRITNLMIDDCGTDHTYFVAGCFGTIDGREVEVSLPFAELPKNSGEFRYKLTCEGRKANVDVYQLGFFFPKVIRLV